MDNFNIHLWDEEQFRNSREEWTKLLEHSASDKLFMSWEWLFTWWDVFSETETMQLKLIVAYDFNGKLVGIAPLYTSIVYTKKFFKTRRLQFIGNCWRGQKTMRTELQDFITDSSCALEVILAIYRYINNSPDWDELVLSDLDISSDTYRLLLNRKILKHAYYRYAEKFNSYYLGLKGEFSDYCVSLGKNTRLKLLNRRKVLESMGEVEFSDVADKDLSSTFELLNSLHAQRWGMPVFEGERLRFNLAVARLMSQKKALRFSVITLNSKPVSIQYNYVVDKREYNIQAGFDEKFHRKISLGYLHFGYEIEAAYKRGIQEYDFLAGEGKNTQYKERLTDTNKTIVSMQIVRNRLLRALYSVYDFIQKHFG